MAKKMMEVVKEIVEEQVEAPARMALPKPMVVFAAAYYAVEECEPMELPEAEEHELCELLFQV